MKNKRGRAIVCCCGSVVGPFTTWMLKAKYTNAHTGHDRDPCLGRVLNTTMEVPPTVFLEGVMGNRESSSTGNVRNQQQLQQQQLQQPLVPLPLQVSSALAS